MRTLLLFFFSASLMPLGSYAPERGDAQNAAQQQQEPVCKLCPTIYVQCPDRVMQGSPVKFTAKIAGAGPSPSLSLSWRASAGLIISGQNQHVSAPDSSTDITVDTAGLIGGETITATVEVGGLARSCANEASCTTALIRPPPLEHFDEYGDINLEYEQARLDTYVVSLQEDPTMEGYIVCYGGRRGRRGEAMARCERARNYLVKRRGFNPDRIILVDGGFMEDLTVVLWVLPPNMKPPVDPTVDPSEVQFIERTQKRGGRTARRRRSG